MGGWFFARGRQGEQTLSDPVAAGAERIELAGADTIFNATELLFISEADGTETEFLGGVTAVDAEGVSFTLPPKRPKNSGAKLWKPITRFSLAAERFAPPTRVIETGVAVDRSLGGTFYAVRTAELLARMTLQWEGLPSAHEEAFAAWIESATQGGLLPFTIVFPSRRIEAVRLDGGAYSRIEKADETRAVKLPLLIEAEGEYR